jgi:hypothetical protein
MRRLAYFLVAVGLFSLPSVARAQEADERQQYVRDIVVHSGETTGDLICYFCSIRVRGTVKGDAIAIGGGIEIDGTVVGDAVAAGGGIRLGPGAKVGGDAVAAGGRLERGAQTSVGGDVESKWWFYVPGQRQLFLPCILLYTAVNLGLVLVSSLVLRRRRVAALADTIAAHPVWTLLAGVGVLLAATVLLRFSGKLGEAGEILDTGVTIALAVTMAAGCPGFPLWLGRRLPRVGGSLQAALAGALLLTLLQLVPIAGVFVFLAVILLATGCAVLSGFGSGANWLLSVLEHGRPGLSSPPPGPGAASP